MSKYYAYRTFLQEPRQQSLFDLGSKEEVYKSIFNLLEDNHKASFEDYGSELLLYFNRRLSEDLLILQLAKKQEFDKPVAGEDVIEQVKDVRYPNIYILIHISKQLLLIEKNTSVFQQIETSKNKMEVYLNKSLAFSGITASLGEIVDSKEFWEKVAQYDMVEDVEIDYKPPNFFGAGNDADKIVKDVHEDTGFRKFKIFLENKIEGLKFTKSVFQEHFQRLSSGAGDFAVRVIKDGVDFILKSHNTIFSRQVDDVESIDKERLDDIFEEVDKLNDNEESS
ncbi:hypothetical protein [Ekhidna sp.]|uniref:hypothetical protein n=1 Tax=Ekhidna sp. TaxID=2608089 RepID=UPI003298A1F3